ncbi:MAG: hypothetical protein ABI855_01655 [Bacteroidota bacterium]
MQKITSEEFDNLKLHGRGSTSPLFNALLKLKPGEGLIVYKKEWFVKYPPTRIVNKIERKYKYVFERGALPDRTGWAVKRVK